MDNNNKKHSYEHHEYWTASSDQRAELQPISMPMALARTDHGFAPSAFFNSFETQDEISTTSSIPHSTSIEQWRNYDTIFNSQALVLDATLCSTLYPGSSSSTSSDSPGSHYPSPLPQGFQQPQSLGYVDAQSSSSQQLYDPQSNATGQIRSERQRYNAKQLSIKPRWTSNRREQVNSSPQPAATIWGDSASTRMASNPNISPTHSQLSIVTRNPPKSRPAILNSEPSIRHNQIEKKYRSRLNGEFETLLSVLPPDLVAEVNEARRASRQPEKAISKSEVLALARAHIRRLEEEGEGLETQRRELSEEVERMEEFWVGLGSEEGGGD